MRNLSVAICIVLLIWDVQPLFCQAASAAIGSAVPLENWNIAGQRMGGVSVGLAEEVPHVLANPANLASLDRPQIFLSLNNARRDFVIQPVQPPPVGTSSTEVSWAQGFNLGYSAASLPFHVFKRRWVGAVSYNGRRWGEFDERYVSDAEGFFGFSQRSGHVQSISVGLGIQVHPRIRAGVGWTAWFGKTEWMYHERYAKGIDDYAAQGWHGGVTAELGRFSLGSTIYLPHRVMRSKDTSDPWAREEVIKEFNGALEIGIGYHRWSRWTFGLGYGYQQSFDIQARYQYGYGPLQFNEKYPGFSKVSGGIEYKFSLGEVYLPVYVGYQAFWLHKPVGILPSYLQFSISHEERFRSQLLLGAAVRAASLAFYLDGKQTWDAFQMPEMIFPPFTSLLPSASRFDAKSVEGSFGFAFKF